MFHDPTLRRLVAEAECSHQHMCPILSDRHVDVNVRIESWADTRWGILNGEVIDARMPFDFVVRILCWLRGMDTGWD